MSGQSGVVYELWAGGAAAAAEPLLALARAVFADFDDAYLLGRLPLAIDPMLWLAREGEAWVGFKLGYRRGPDLLYSWLGGVHPRMRGRGVASELMVRQHDQAAKLGYRWVETRTRAANNAMIVLNLRHGFQVAGFESDPGGAPVVIQRKRLGD
ncbi:MAG: GNAT family N-acetyltransferase [Phenylobacterium sp.]|jgi:GNAT superfamily N-acetyltransferase|uniref:GNAT family N-acetyltransferase n=1 Tax=Phenylobacterium sp. TaxID=1871053 RepID=UPI003918ABCE